MTGRWGQVRPVTSLPSCATCSSVAGRFGWVRAICTGAFVVLLLFLCGVDILMFYFLPNEFGDFHAFTVFDPLVGSFPTILGGGVGKGDDSGCPESIKKENVC